MSLPAKPFTGGSALDCEVPHHLGYNPRGPANERRISGPLRHDYWNTVFGLRFLGSHSRTVTHQRVHSPLRDLKLGGKGKGRNRRKKGKATNPGLLSKIPLLTSRPGSNYVRSRARVVDAGPAGY